MASVGHVIVGMVAGRWREQGRPDWRTLGRVMFWMALASLLPDLDVIAFAYGIPYEAAFGHRGASHALAVAPLIAVFPTVTLDGLLRRKPSSRTYLVMTVVVATHGLLDSLTDGGLGPALLWPFSERRIFAPWTPIPVAPIGAGMFSRSGLTVVAAEILLFAPLLAYALWPRRRRVGQ